MSDIETRVDQAFASAVEDQLREQREIRRLVSRVDESLVALSDGLVDLAGQVDRRLAGAALLSPTDLQGARNELVDAIGVVDDHVAAVEERLGDGRALDELRGLMAATRIDLIEAMARLERGAAPVTEAVDETRREVLRALERLGASVDSTRDAGWVDAVGRLDGVIVDLEGRQADRDGIGEQALTDLQAQALAAIDGLRDAAETRLVGTVEAALTRGIADLGADTVERTAEQLVEEVGRAVAAATSDGAAEAARLSQGLAGQVAADAAREAVAAVEASAGELSDVARDQLLAVAGQAARAAADRVALVLTDAGAQLHEDLGRTAAQLDAAATRTSERLEGAAARSDRSAELLDDATATASARVETAAGTVSAQLGSATDAAAAHLDDITAAAAARLDAAAAVGEGTVAAIDAAQAAAAEAAGATYERTAIELEQLLRVGATTAEERLREIASLAAATVLDVTGEADVRTGELAALLDRLAEVTEALDPQLQAVVAGVQGGLAELLDRHQGATADVVAHTLEGLAARADATLIALGDDVRAVTRADSAALATAMEVLVATSTSISETVEEAVDRATASLQATQEASAVQLGLVTQDLARLPDDVRVPVEALLGRVRAGVDGAVADLTAASTAAAGALEPAIRAAMAEAQDALVVTLAEQQARSQAEQAAAIGAIDAAVVAAGSDITAAADVVVARLVDAESTGVTALTTAMEGTASRSEVQLHDLAMAVVTEVRAALVDMTSASERLVARLEATSTDATSGLTARVDLATERVDDASARIAHALERLDDAGESLSRRLTDAEQTVAGQFTGDVEAATARLRTDLDEALETTAARLATTGETALQSLTEKVGAAGERIDRATAAIDEAARSTTTTTAELHTTSATLGATLASTGEEVVGALREVMAEVTDGMVGESASTRAALSALLEGTTAQVQAAMAEAQAELAAQIASLRDESRLDADRRQRAVGQIEQTAGDVVAEVAAIVERVDAGVADRLQRSDAEAATTVERLAGSSAVLSRQLADTVATFSADLDRTLAAVGDRVDVQTAAVAMQVTRLGGVEEAATARLDATVGAATDRLMAELEQTRAVLREAVIAGSDTDQVNLTAIRTEVERLLATTGSRVADLEDTIGRAAETTDQRGAAAMAQLQSVAADTVAEVATQLTAVQAAVTAQLAAAEERRVQDVDRVAAVAQRVERTVETLPGDVAAVVEQVRSAMLDSAQDTQRRQTNSVTEMTTTVQGLRAEVTEAVGRLQRRGEVSVATATEAGMADLRAGMRADADAVLDAMAQQADQVLGGLAEQSERVLASMQQAEEALRGTLTDAFRMAQDEGLGRLDEATPGLVAIGEMRGEDDRTAEALAELAAQVAALVSREDARRHRWAQPRPREEDAGATRTPTPPNPPPTSPPPVLDDVVTPRALGHVCEDCGFVAKTPPGLTAHRRTCLAARGR